MCDRSRVAKKSDGALREFVAVVIIEDVPHATGIGEVSFGCEIPPQSA
jgi:hypothetical protein